MSNPKLTFTWRRPGGGSLISRCACGFLQNSGPIPDEEVRDKVIVLVTRQHVKDCPGPVV